MGSQIGCVDSQRQFNCGLVACGRYELRLFCVARAVAVREVEFIQTAVAILESAATEDAGSV